MGVRINTSEELPHNFSLFFLSARSGKWVGMPNKQRDYAAPVGGGVGVVGGKGGRGFADITRFLTYPGPCLHRHCFLRARSFHLIEPDALD